MRPIRKTVQPSVGIPTQPPMDSLAGDTEPVGYLGHRKAGLHFNYGAIPLFRHAHLHQHSAECHASSEANV